MLTPKERLRMILDGQNADRPACICPGGMMNMVTSELMDKVKVHMPEAHNDARQMADLAKAVYEEGCFENYGVPFCMTVEAEEMGAKVDMGSHVYEPHVVEYVIDSVSDYKRLTPVDITRGRAKVVLDAIRILKEETEGVPIVGNLTGPISTASSVMEPVVFYKELRKKNQEAHEYMEFITEQLIAFGRAQIEAGADIIAISDPSGTGEILGPKYFKEFAVTYINNLLDSLQDEKMGSIVHICGQMSPVYKEVNEVHSSALSFDSIVPMKEAREHLKDRVLMGNVSTYALEFGDPDRVKMLTRGCVKNGSDIISPACGLGMKSPLANVQSILACLKEDA
ncbi:uroporphyrinogen decarboxylase family protein [Bariatricus sp. SGI.154]|uniref:uroporphyrinogen decarboxylase family protein n=1 Tax=Bariatricus sp. SGI.154 TaxID=3420549 RepID=UPI003D07FCE7